MQRVVVTGIGVASAIGSDESEFLTSLENGHCGIKFQGDLKEKGYPIPIGAKVPKLNLKKYWNHKPAPHKHLYHAIKNALKNYNLSKENLGLYINGPACSVESSENYLNDYISKKSPSTLDLSFSSMDSLVNDMCYELQLGGPRTTLVTACSSSTLAIALGFDLIRNSKEKAILVGGADGFSHITYAGFNSLKNLSPEPCTPFDKERKGLSFGEGAGVLLLENLVDAKKRGAPIYAELISYGAYGEGYNLTAPHPEGVGFYQSMMSCIKKAKISPEEVEVINAHGTATYLNDKIEAESLAKIFPNKTLIHSNKGNIGHCMGAAGALEAVSSILSLKHQLAFKTANLKEVDPDFKLTFNKETRETSINYLLSNSAGFGGNNASLLFKRFL